LQRFIGNPESEKVFSLHDAQKLMRERNYFAAMMVNVMQMDWLLAIPEVTPQLLNQCYSL
jgi:hypothetical protein